MKFRTLILLMGIILLVCTISACEDKEFKLEIISLRTQETIDGSFFLGCGSINQEIYYFTYSKIGNKTYRLRRFLTRRSIIIEDSPEQPYVHVLTNWEGVIRSVRFHVPEGTIVRQFKLE